MELPTRVCNAFLASHPDDAARLIEELPAPERAGLLQTCAEEAAARVLQVMAPHHAAQTLASLEAATGAALMARLPNDLAVLLLRRSPEDVREALLGSSEPRLADSLRRRLHYREGTVGAVMDPLVLALPADLTAEQALDQVHRLMLPVGFYLYVVDRQGRLVGVTTLGQLVRADPQSTIRSLMQHNVIHLSASASHEELDESPFWREYRRLPVVDRRGVLVGVVRYESIRRAYDESRDTVQSGSGLGALMALGELYWTGLAGILTGMSPGAVRPAGITDARGSKDDDR